MKYSDCPTVEVETHIAAPPESVWPWVADIQLPARFSTEFQGATWCDDSPHPGVGARFIGRNSHPVAGQWETTCTLVGYQPERLFAWVVQGIDNPAASWRFELAPESGGTRLCQWVRMGPGRSLLNDFIDSMPEREEQIVQQRLEAFRTGMVATIEGIKALAEQVMR